ncbi:MAG TPA: hypothetical protein VGI95_19850 [Caulobacteraceae bacterium]|jgi:hypothetical protein
MRLFLAVALVSMTFAATALASPAGLLVIRQTVTDYAKWRPAYDAHKSGRDDAGLSNCTVRSSVDNPNDVFVMCTMAGVAKAKAFASSKALADRMAAAGVVGKPDFYFTGPTR